MSNVTAPLNTAVDAQVLVVTTGRHGRQNPDVHPATYLDYALANPVERGYVSDTLCAPYGGIEGDVPSDAQTTYEARKELNRSRKEVSKARDLDRRNKRKSKRSQCY